MTLHVLSYSGKKRNLSVVKAKAKNIILDLLSAQGGQPVTAQQLIAACALFGVTANNVRVTLARLSAEGLVEAAGRGSYRLGPEARELAGEVATWRNAEQRMRDWSGGFIQVFTGELGRSNRVALRRRQRALGMLGFKEYKRGLYLRPDNIERDLNAVRTRLGLLGLEAEACICVVTEFACADADRVMQLWDGAQLSQRYRKLSQQLRNWLQRSTELEPDVAAREAFVQGGQAIRQVVFDPLLPAPMIDAAARHDFLQTVSRFDEAGRAIWQRFFEQTEPVLAPATGTAAQRRSPMH